MLARELKSSFHSLSSNTQSSSSNFTSPLPRSGLRQMPWRRISNPSEPSAVYILAKRNYKLYANIVETSRNTRPFSIIVDTGAGSSFIRLVEVPPPLRQRIKPLDGTLTIRKESGKSVPIVGSVPLVVQIGTSQSTLTFLVDKQLVADVILGCDYCDHYVQSIRPRRFHVEIDNASIVPIVHQPHVRRPESSLPNDADPTSINGKNLPSLKIQVTKRIVIPHDSQTCVEVISKHDGLILVNPDSKLLTNQMSLMAAGVANVRREEPVKVLVANFRSTPIKHSPPAVNHKSFRVPCEPCVITHQRRLDAQPHPGHIEGGQIPQTP